jgi:hypothetical protein
MAQSDAQKAEAAKRREEAKAASAAARQVRAQSPDNPDETVVIERLELIPETGVVLDTEDPNYESQKELEELRAEVRSARQELLTGSVTDSAKVDEAQQELEKQRLRAELASIRNQQAAQGGGVAAVMSQVEAQRAEADAQLDAATNASEGN